MNSHQNTQVISSNRLLNLWIVLRGYRLSYLAAIVSMGAAAAARSASYLLIGYFADQVLKQRTFFPWLPWVALSFVGLAVLEGGFTFLGKCEAARVSEGIAQRLRNELFDHIQRLPFQFHDKWQTGELIQRATSDVDAVRKLFADQAINAGRILALFFVNVGVMLALNWRLTLLSIVAIPFVILFAYIFFQKISVAYEAFQEQEAILTSVLQENLSGVRVVKAFARQSYEMQKFQRENWEKYLRGCKLLLLHALFWPTSDIIIGLQMLTGFFLAALMAIDGKITAGTYISYAGMLIWVLWPIRNLGQLLVEMSKGLVSIERVGEILLENKEDLKSGDVMPSASIKGEVVFDTVSFSYRGEETAQQRLVLQDISFSCKPGQVIAFIGATGSGKTTLANLLPRFYDYTSGKIWLDGVELNRYPRYFLRMHIGIVEQEPFLFSRTIAENIALGVKGKVNQHQIEDAAKAAAIHDSIMRFPQGYQTVVGEKGVTLSGGQKQRIAIARTILRDPRILILDDATSAVDTETESEIRNAIEQLMIGRTTFIIAHRVQSVMNADQIIVFERGRVVQQGTHEQLLAQRGPYRQIFEIQTQIETELEKELALLG